MAYGINNLAQALMNSMYNPGIYHRIQPPFQTLAKRLEAITFMLQGT